MTNERAAQIMKTSDIVEILYQGSPVWVEDIENDNAIVTYLETKTSIEVPIVELLEKKIVG